jgi:predicted enzyme related to lactoylglutathione lyase
MAIKRMDNVLIVVDDPDGQGIELDKFHTPDATKFGPVDGPVNTLGLRRVMLAVDDIDSVLARMREHGAEVIGEMQYEHHCRACRCAGGLDQRSVVTGNDNGAG